MKVKITKNKIKFHGSFGKGITPRQIAEQLSMIKPEE